MAIDFNAINGKFSQMASQFQSPALVNAADKIKNEFQAKAESMFGKVGELEDTYETLTANLSGDALEKALKDMAGEVKGGMQAIGPVASDLVDKVKILEPQIAKATQEIADKIPAMKEAISSSDLTNLDKVFTAASTGVTAIDIHDIFPAVETTIENVAEMNFDIITNANLEGITTALQETIQDIPLEDLQDVMNDIVPSDILGVGIPDPLQIMKDFQGGEQLSQLTAAATAATKGFNDALGGLAGAGGSLLGALETTQSVISDTIFGAVPNFNPSKLKDLTEAYGSGDALKVRSLAIENIEISDGLQKSLGDLDIPVTFGSTEDLQDILSKANGLLGGSLLRELDALQNTVTGLFNKFPDKLPTPGSFLKPPTALSTPTLDVVSFKGGSPSVPSKVSESLNSAPIISLSSLYSIRSYFQSTQREISTMVVDWTGTYNDQNMTAEDVDAYYKANGLGGNPYHIVITKSGIRQAGGRSLEQLPDLKNGYNKFAVGVVLVAGYDQPTPTDGFEAGGSFLSGSSVTPRQYTSLKLLLRGFYEAIPLGQVYGMNDLNADRTSVLRSGPGISMSAVAAETKLDKNNIKDAVALGRFASLEELKVSKDFVALVEGED